MGTRGDTDRLCHRHHPVRRSVRVWLVHRTYLDLLKKLLDRYFLVLWWYPREEAQTNYRFHQNVPPHGNTQRATSAHEALYVTPGAPEEVVRASYRALVQKHHPDHGGRAEDFIRVQKAYEELSR